MTWLKPCCDWWFRSPNQWWVIYLNEMWLRILVWQCLTGGQFGSMKCQNAHKNFLWSNDGKKPVLNYLVFKMVEVNVWRCIQALAWLKETRKRNRKWNISFEIHLKSQYYFKVISNPTMKESSKNVKTYIFTYNSVQLIGYVFDFIQQSRVLKNS